MHAVDIKKPAESGAPDTDRYKWLALATVGIGTFMAPLDGSVVNIALPHIASSLRATLPTVEWVVMMYLLVISTLLLTYGRLGDMIGHKPVYLAGFVIFTAGSLLCGFSPAIGYLIAFRAVQAIGAGMMMAIGPAIVTSAFPAHERGKALGMNAMVVATALALGPTIGGLLVSTFGWRSIFFINLPIGVFGTIWAWRVLRMNPTVPGQSFDVPGAITIFVALTALLLALSKGQDLGWSSLPIVSLLAAAVVFGALFLLNERRVAQPMMDLSLFENRLFSAANLSALLNFMAQSAVTFLMPFYLENVRHLEAAHAGLVLSPMPLVVLVAAPFSGSLSDKIGSRLLSSTGMAVIALDLGLLSRLGVATPLLLIGALLAIAGLGAGLFQSPNNSAIMGSVPKHRLGIASGMLASMRNIGMVVGVALSGAILTNRLPVHASRLSAQGLAGDLLQKQAFVLSFHDSFVVAAVLAAIGVLTSLIRGKHVPVQRGE
ncbi:MAG: MFS transporter [Firmicutes bacterium]|nr:MFS transporter [Bacillota bacterium]